MLLVIHMNLINISHLKKSYGTNTILDDINFMLNSNDKVAIVGRNGAGKSTLIKIIYGLEEYDNGSIFIQPNLNIGYFSQESLLNSNNTVIEEMHLIFKKQNTLKKELQKLEKEITTENKNALEKYNRLLVAFEEIGGYTFEYQINTILNKFGFENYYNHKVNNLSGGERTRLALAKLLLSEPDILILDEPTNHLDIKTVEYLENFLKTYKHAIIIISHDRYFLNQVVNKVYEIEYNNGYEYRGNYDQYVIAKNKFYEQRKKEYSQQQKMIQKEQDFINKNIVRATTTKRAQSRRKKLAKLKVLDNPKIDNKNIKVNLNFTKNTGNIVLEVNNLSIGYDKPFLNNINFLIKKEEKIAILGPNGIGKSTLLKTINNAIPQLNGDIKYGANVNIAYFDQDLALIASSKTLLDEIWDDNRTMLEKDIRTLLGTFLFTDNDVYKNVNDLSGGEKVRLALAKLSLKKANFLILDEVTNHLDIMSREVLESALINFPGTILFVSHDRFFINKVATRIIEFNNNKVNEYIGDYNYYLEQKEKEEQTLIKTPNNLNIKNDYEKQKKEKNELRKKEKQIKKLEKEITELEKEINYLKNEQHEEEVYLDYKKALEIQSKIDKLQEIIDNKISEWTVIHEQLEL